MSMLRIAIIGSCAVVALAALLASRDDTVDGPAPSMIGDPRCQPL